MLSKVAERVYWAARYIERIENTARLISIYDKLLFDMPRNFRISWYNLITINSMEAQFEERYKVKDEVNVMKFLIGDTHNYSSIQSSLNAVRENVRTTRDVLPDETWELINELSIYVEKNIGHGLKRSKRHEFLEDIIKGCLQIQGLLGSSMPKDAAWEFVALGRTLERADMTTRNLDAGMAAIMSFDEGDEALVNHEQFIWGNVLRSLNADQAYRRNQRAAVYGNLVVDYLLYNQALPRSISRCIDVLLDSTCNLPRNEEVLDFLMKMKQDIADHDEAISMGEPLRDFLNDLQIQLGELHSAISRCWFPQWQDA